MIPPSVVGGIGAVIGERFGACGILGIGNSAQYEPVEGSEQHGHRMLSLSQSIPMYTEGNG